MLEIERKFLVTERAFEGLKFQSSDILEPLYRIKQGYLVNTPDVAIRVRIDERIGNKTRPPLGILCIKKPVDGSLLVRSEEEHDIGTDRTEYILECLETLEKTRWRFGPYVIDVYEGDLKGLYVAEREYPTVEEANADSPPHWIDSEVTGDVKYLNSNLIGKKFINGAVA